MWYTKKINNVDAGVDLRQSVLAKKLAAYLRQQKENDLPSDHPEALYNNKTYTGLESKLKNNDGFCQAMSCLWMYGMRLSTQPHAKWLQTEICKNRNKVIVTNNGPTPDKIEKDTIVVVKNDKYFNVYWSEEIADGKHIIKSRSIDIKDIELLPEDDRQLFNESKEISKNSKQLIKIMTETSSSFRSDNEWFKKTTNLLAKWDEKRQLTDQEKYDIEIFLSYITSFQRYYYDGFSDPDRRGKNYETYYSDMSMDFTAMMTDSNDKSPDRKLRVDFSSVDEKQLKQLLGMPDLLPKKQMIYITGSDIVKHGGHAVSVFRRDDNSYVYLDSNSETGEITVKTIEQLVKLIFQSMRDINFISPDEKISITASIFSYDSDKYVPPNNKAIINYFKKINPDIALMRAVNVFEYDNDTVDIIKDLVNKGANPNAQNNTAYMEKKSPLITVIIKKNIGIINDLLKSKNISDGINNKDSHGNTALLYAILFGIDIDTIKILVEKDSDPYAENCNNLSAIKIALDYGNIDVINELLNSKFDINSLDKNGDTVLMYAINNKLNINIIKALIEKGANPYVKNNKNINAIKTALNDGNMSPVLVNELLNSKFDINSLDKNGNNILMSVVENNYKIDNIKLLMRYKFDLALTNKKGETALDIAIAAKHSEMINNDNDAVIGLLIDNHVPMNKFSKDLLDAEESALQILLPEHKFDEIEFNANLNDAIDRKHKYVVSLFLKSPKINKNVIKNAFRHAVDTENDSMIYFFLKSSILDKDIIRDEIHKAVDSENYNTVDSLISGLCIEDKDIINTEFRHAVAIGNSSVIRLFFSIFKIDASVVSSEFEKVIKNDKEGLRKKECVELFLYKFDKSQITRYLDVILDFAIKTNNATIVGKLLPEMTDTFRVNAFIEASRNIDNPEVFKKFYKYFLDKAKRKDRACSNIINDVFMLAIEKDNNNKIIEIFLDDNNFLDRAIIEKGYEVINKTYGNDEAIALFEAKYPSCSKANWLIPGKK